MYFTSRITLAGFCHQTFNTQHVLNSFQEISGKYSLFRLLNPLTLLFYSVPKKLSQLLTMLLGQKKKKRHLAQRSVQLMLNELCSVCCNTMVSVFENVVPFLPSMDYYQQQRLSKSQNQLSGGYYLS